MPLTYQLLKYYTYQLLRYYTTEFAVTKIIVGPNSEDLLGQKFTR